MKKIILFFSLFVFSFSSESFAKSKADDSGVIVEDGTEITQIITDDEDDYYEETATDVLCDEEDVDDFDTSTTSSADSSSAVTSHDVSTTDIDGDADGFVVSAPTRKLMDFFSEEEQRVCIHMHRFAENRILKDPDVLRATKKRDSKAVSKAASEYADALEKKFNTDFLFYHPNARSFVKVNDKNYRGRVRLPISELDVDFSDEIVCYWERLPSQDVVFSALVKAPGDNAGYFKLSRKMTRMLTNLPDALSSFGTTRVHSALDKTGLKKMAWFKMRNKEPNKVPSSKWCTAENLVFLTSIGNGKRLSKKEQSEVLSLADKGQGFSLANGTMSGGILPIKDIDDKRIGAIIYTTTTPEYIGDIDEKPTTDEAEDTDKTEDMCLTKIEKLLYRFFD